MHTYQTKQDSSFHAVMLSIIISNRHGTRIDKTYHRETRTVGGERFQHSRKMQKKVRSSILIRSLNRTIDTYKVRKTIYNIERIQIHSENLT